MTLGELITRVKADQIDGDTAIEVIRDLRTGSWPQRARFRLTSALSMARIYYSPLGAAKYGGPARVKQMILEDLTIAQGAINSSTPTE
jgi:ribosome-binding factor A